MKYNYLGNSGLNVSRLCFGSLAIGPLQTGMTPEDGAGVILKALELGVNFIDTAELYGTYPHIREALKRYRGKRPVISSKSYAYSRQAASDSIQKALKEMDIEAIDIFMLHEQESQHTLRGHREALEYYIECKQKGLIKAVGVSTHRCEVVEICGGMPEIDVIHPIINRKGLGIGDGTIDRMVAAAQKAALNGKGILAMKSLGGGNLAGTYEESMKFVLGLDFVHSIAVGMKNADEVIANVCFFNEGAVPDDIKDSISRSARKLHIEYWCDGCGRCADECGQSAIRVCGGKAVVDDAKCILCGYCGAVCSNFAIKVF